MSLVTTCFSVWDNGGVHRNPSAWKSYRQAVDDGRADHLGELSRFQARYSMASRLEDVTFEGLGEATSAGYTEALRVGLCYSALEALECVPSIGKGSVRVDSLPLADAFRSSKCTQLRELLLKHTSRQTKVSIEKLASDESQVNVRWLAAGMRHLMFHGVLTPWGAGLGKSKWMRSFVCELSREVLAAADARMTTWASEAGFWEVPPSAR